MSIEVRHGDCRMRIIELDNASIDSVVTDPPYALVSIQKRFGKPGSAEAKDRDGLYKRASAGFMGKQWDTGEVAFDPAFWMEVLRVVKPGGHLLAFGGTRSYHRLASAIEDAGFEIRDQIGWTYGSGFPKSHNQDGKWEGWGTALKPAWEPICVARKPLIGTVAENLAAHGTGAINIAACRVGDMNGRWPANMLHDGSDEVLAAFPEAPGQMGDLVGHSRDRKSKGIYGDMSSACDAIKRGDSGSAARFFYCAKASKKDRAGSKHPTVKPIALMRYLCRLVTPPGGTVLDPFAGSGTTLQAAMEEGFHAIGFEREDEYVADIRRRLGLPAASDVEDLVG